MTTRAPTTGRQPSPSPAPRPALPPRRKPPELARRELLRRLGVGALCLPLLGGRRLSAAPAARATGLICVVQTNGYRQAGWRPPVGPLDPSLPSSCSALQPFRDQLTYLLDLTNPGVTGPGYGTLFYGAGPRPVGGTGTYREPLGPTLDQVVGQAMQAPSGRVAVNLGVQVDRVPRASLQPGASRCFWLGPGAPINPVLDPYFAYTSIAGGPIGADPRSAVRVAAEKKLILDYVGKSLDQFKDLLGRQDRPVVDAHLEALRDFERQVSGPAYPGCTGGTSFTMVDLEAASSYPAIVEMQLQLAVLAQACGISRVTTVQLADASANNVIFNFVGVPQLTNSFPTWRNIARGLYGLAARDALDRWCMERLARLLTILSATPSGGGGTLLDGVVVLWANTMDDGVNRNYQKLPWILAGRGAGFFRGGQALDCSGKPLAGVLAEVANSLGVTAHPFGAPLDGLRA